MCRAVYCLVLLLSLSPLLSAQDAQSSLPEAPAQSLTPNLAPPDGLWNRLLEQTQSLPQAFNDYQANLTAQITSLRNSNKLLIDSNSDLIIKNLSLTESLKASKAEAKISEAKSAQLQTDLDNSTASIIRAEKEATALELRAARWKIAGIAGLTIGLGGLIYGLTR